MEEGLTANMISLNLRVGNAEEGLTANMIEEGLLARIAGSSISEEEASVIMVFEGLNVPNAGVARYVSTERG